MAQSPWYAFYVGDYLRDTAHLSMTEHGAYRLLLDHYFSTKQPLPTNAEQLHRICRAFGEQEQIAVAKIVEQFFKNVDGVFRNKRADEELEKQYDISAKRSKAAKSKKKQKQANAKQMQSKCTPIDDTTTTTVTKREGKPSLPPTPMLPEWVPLDAWNGFREMRRAIKEPMTELAIDLMLKKLDKLRLAGHDPSTVLNNSIRNNWKDIYEPKDKSHGTKPTARHSGFAEQDYTAGTDGFELV